MSSSSSSPASSRLARIQGHMDSSMAAQEVWASVPQAPPDAIFKLTAAYKADKFDKKVNLGVGAYRDNQGKPWVLPSVQKAQSALIADTSVDHEYLSITGLAEFTNSAAKLILGRDAAAVSEGRVSSVQTISGTGANHLAAVFLSKFFQFPGGEKQIFISNPTWANHKAIFSSTGIKPIDYPYYDAKTVGLDYEGFTGALKSAPNGSVILLHACAHNPTGVDPTKEQWGAIADIFAAKGHLALFDCAYQGFASGNLDEDAFSVRHFAQRRDIPIVICQSFAKNAGLYGERVGALHVVSAKQPQAAAVTSQLSVIQRSEISNPPAFGARVVAMILNDDRLWKQWNDDVRTMAERIIAMRKQLHSLLTDKYKTPAPGGNWDHIIKQIGMFSYLGLTEKQCAHVVDQGHIYITSSARASMAGLNDSNVDYVAASIDRAVRSA